MSKNAISSFLKHHKPYLTSEGRRALLKAGAAAIGVIGTAAFFVAPRRRDWQTTAKWKEIEKHRYAHRGLFDVPPSAQAYPKGMAGDPFKGVGKGDGIMQFPDKIVQFTDKVITKSPDAVVAPPLWKDDVSNWANLVPENSLPAFRAAAEDGYGVEMDVRLTKDNVPVVVHDSDLERVCGRAGFVEQLTHEELCEYRLLGTDEQIPTFSQAIALFDTDPQTKHRCAPVLIELKTTVTNYADLVRLVMLTLDRYDVDYCIQSFDTRVLWWLRHHRPGVLRGQLSEDFLLDLGTEKYGLPLRVGQSWLLCNVMGRPDYIAYKFADRHNPFVWLATRLMGARMMTWTVRSEADLAESEREGAPAIFEHIRPETKSRLSK
ncbi:glycerophosphodiester phosphodiesterase family protein [Olegusella massiliensis]|uniref:glycerophosphodiester phosphodiesterase family protein n=1 Tax=Olegusella massiliensis TaxID=1776381 RepID=UPI00405597FF